MSKHQARIAANVAAMEISIIKEMAMRAAKVPHAVSLAWGLPSFPTPQFIRDAVSAAFASDPAVGRYTLPDGRADFRALIAAHHARETGTPVDADDNVLVTAGNMQGMNVLLHVLLNAGDEVIVTDPGFPSHLQQIRLCGAEPRFWPLDEARGWELDVARLDALITPRTRAIILVSPSNPTGRVFAREALLAAAEQARRHDLTIVVDDPYSRFLHDTNAIFFNLAAARGLGAHIAYLFTFSKCYAMSGWRLGYMIVPGALKREVLKVHDANIICAPHVSQVAGMAALRAQTPPYHEFARVIARRRKLICERLDRLPEVFAYVPPQGAYYVFPRILAAHRDSREFALRLLDATGVSMTPGIGFGPSGEHHLRLAFCVDDDTINEGFDRLETYFAGRRPAPA